MKCTLNDNSNLEFTWKHLNMLTAVKNKEFKSTRSIIYGKKSIFAYL